MKQQFKQTMALYISVNFIFSPLYGAELKVRIENQRVEAAQINRLEIDVNHNRVNTNIVKSRNGVDVVNIGRVNNRGVSHNRFRNYNVEEKGLILNNSGQRVDTQLAGEIEGNDNLAKNESAKLIINEVTGTHVSEMNGYTEVAGDAADVVVANPNGIKVNGGGFINTPQTTLTTGRLNMRGGELQSIEQRGAAVVIEEDGLTVDGGLSIVSQNIDIEGDIVAQDIELRAGNGIVDYKTGEIRNSRALRGDVIDSTVYGGMYANSIDIAVSSKGAGINLGADVIAGSGGFHVDSNGKIILGKAISQANIELKSKQLDVKKLLDAQQNILVEAEDIYISNAIAKEDVNLKSSRG